MNWFKETWWIIK
jgi:hypothetical protein